MRVTIIFMVICLSSPLVGAHSQVDQDDFMFELQFTLIKGKEKEVRQDLRRNKLVLIGGQNVDQKKFKAYHRDIFDALFQLDDLVEISLENLGLIVLPTRLVELKKLRALSVKDNELSFVPSDISNLRRLTRLNLKGNPLIPDGGQRRWGVKEIEEWRAAKRKVVGSPHDYDRHDVIAEWYAYNLVRKALETSRIRHEIELFEALKEKKNIHGIAQLYARSCAQSILRQKLFEAVQAKNPNFSEREVNEVIDVIIKLRPLDIIPSRLITAFQKYKDPAVVMSMLSVQNPSLDITRLLELMDIYVLHRFDYTSPLVYKLTPELMDQIIGED